MMARRIPVPLLSAVTTLVVAAPPSLAADLVVECRGAVVPSAPGACAGVDEAGCCDALGRVLWCDGADLYCVDCASLFPSCGWRSEGYYDCGAQAGSQDPSGQHPRACGGCDPSCGGGKGAPVAPCSATCPGQCGACAAPGEVCLEDGACRSPACGDRTCGKDPAGLSCGTCGDGSVCVPGVFQCAVLPPGCVPRDGPGCPGCGCSACVCKKYPQCCDEHWDQFCASACDIECGQDCSGCPAEPSCDAVECGSFCGVSCGPCADGLVCSDFRCCARACDGHECGPDGCGGSCGTCEGSDVCSAGQCVPCQPQCGGKQCGDDGCGGECGTCVEGTACQAGACVEASCLGVCGGQSVSGCYCDNVCKDYGDCCPDVCALCPEMCCSPACDGKACGDDGCGGSCGDCAPGWKCEAGACVACAPACGTAVCGDDGCGGSCGECPPGDNCEAGACVACAPACGTAVCGDDGCGGSCGECKEGDACIDFACVPDPCSGVTYEGCCDGDVLKYCYADTGFSIVEVDCAAQGPKCGWNAGAGWYDCNTDGGEDPSGRFPKACPACTPDCAVPEPGPELEPSPEPVPEPEPEPALEPVPDPAPDLPPEPEPVPESDPEPEPVPESDPVPEPGPDPLPDPGPPDHQILPDIPAPPDADATAPPDSHADPGESATSASGGCASGAPSAAPGLLAVAALLVLASRRPRRRVLAAFAAALLCACSSSAPATDTAPDSPADLPPDVPEVMDVTIDHPPDPAPDPVPEPEPEPVPDLPADFAPDPDPAPDPVPEPEPEPESMPEPVPEPVPESAADLPESDDLPEPADVPEPVDAVLPPYDCAALPPGPFYLEKIPNAIASEDIAFDSKGNLVGSNNEALFKTKFGGKAKLWVPNVHNRAGMRYLPDGTLILCDDQLGRVLAFDPEGVQRVLVQGLAYPNGVTSDMKGFVYVTEHDGNRVLRIHPYTGEYTVLTDKIPNPNGVIFNPDFTALYVGSFATGWVYRLSISPDGVPGKLVEWASPAGPGGLLDGIGVDACGNVYVCEYGNTDIWRIPATGGPAKLIVHGQDTYLPNFQWGTGDGWDPYSIYVPDGWAIGVWRIRLGVPSAPRPFP
ncbi:MAG: SMP-30/gluconolactonase/LRE family protein [Deltaproteobacteria bacterium]|nr:SMP-30/gluconolactonase/LRE family protein [Deltaproteobacteria bacterium]